jgi:hypothetical protein
MRVFGALQVVGIVWDFFASGYQNGYLFFFSPQRWTPPFQGAQDRTLSVRIVDLIVLVEASRDIFYALWIVAHTLVMLLCTFLSVLSSRQFFPTANTLFSTHPLKPASLLDPLYVTFCYFMHLNRPQDDEESPTIVAAGGEHDTEDNFSAGGDDASANMINSMSTEPSRMPTLAEVSTFLRKYTPVFQKLELISDELLNDMDGTLIVVEEVSATLDAIKTESQVKFEDESPIDTADASKNGTSTSQLHHSISLDLLRRMLAVLAALPPYLLKSSTADKLLNQLVTPVVFRTLVRGLPSSELLRYVGANNFPCLAFLRLRHGHLYASFSFPDCSIILPFY